MKIGFDFDDVLVELIDCFLDFNNCKYKDNLKKEDFWTYDFWKVMGISKKEGFERVEDFFSSYYHNSIQLVEGAFDTIFELSKKNLLYCITHRPSRFRGMTQDILDCFGNSFEGLYHSDEYILSGGSKYGDKRIICDNLGIDVMVEDSFDNLISCVNGSQRYGFLFDKPWNKNFNEKEFENIERFYFFDDLLSKLNFDNGKI